MFFDSTRSVCLLPGLPPTPPFGLFCCQVCYGTHPLGCSVARFAIDLTLWVVLLPGLPLTPPFWVFCCQVCHGPHPLGCSVARFAMDPTLWVVLLPGLPLTPARETWAQRTAVWTVRPRTTTSWRSWPLTAVVAGAAPPSPSPSRTSTTRHRVSRATTAPKWRRTP